MSISNILSTDGVALNVRAHCKREALQQLSRMAASATDHPCDGIFDVLMERERLGSTGLGHGVAVPHGKIDGLDQVTGVFIRLETPVDFDALDGEPVDLVFLLLAPANATAAHLKALAKVARLLSDSDTRDALRNADSVEDAFAIAATDRKSNAA
ncbi:MAG: PTS IIA-like nitrogen regulatory protein PtsN [Pseudomonadota bacterium]